MAYTRFPDYAQWLADDYGITSGGDLNRDEMEDGYVHQSPKTSLGRHELSLTYRLASQADYEAFEAWRRDDLANGARYFAWPDVADPSGNTLRRARIVSGQVQYKALTDRFDHWSASFTLEYWA
ncbi:MAG: hypothetical protein FWG56_11490 [Desulfovibrionaceae bacterium]|jgi:hypothetical protein|nr:hypothetical protein [Desulfovibrionaceae bacterium]